MVPPTHETDRKRRAERERAGLGGGGIICKNVFTLKVKSYTSPRGDII